jgi:3-hydroxy acid dehydrogenase/malonic semialdehyde reductase
MKGHLALITGATAGIGHATAEKLAALGADLILTGRRIDRLEKIATELAQKYKVHVTPLAFDISSREETEKAFERIADDLPRLSILVNNAGLALGAAPLQTVGLGDVDQMIDTNIKGLLYVTRLALPHLIKRCDSQTSSHLSPPLVSHVVNMGSVAGRWTYPGGATYSATKFAVRALTEGLRMDLMGTPVRVTNIEPGMVETEFSEVRYDGDQEKAASVYKGMTPLQASDIAETIVWCLSRPKHVNIQELVIYPVDQAAVGPYISRK